jgi:tetratricopeptide (TPR) repeat protein
MYKQRFYDWGVFKYERARIKRIEKNKSLTSAPAPPMFDSPPLVGSTSMSRTSSNTSNRTSFSNHLMDDIEPYDLAGNGWGCLQYSCPEPAACAHRHCIKTHLSGLQQQQQQQQQFQVQVAPTSHPVSGSSPYNYMPIPRHGSVEKVIHCVNQFSDTWMYGEMNINDAQQQMLYNDAEAANIIADYPGHCSHKASPKQCERCTWAEFDFGLAMLEDGHTDVAVSSFELGCRLAYLLLSAPSKLWIRNLVMAFGSSRWERHEGFRHGILEYLAMMAVYKLGHTHPITVILQCVKQGDTLFAAAEPALRAMIAAFERATGVADPDILLIKRSLSVILRRQQKFHDSEVLLLGAIADSEGHNGYAHKETRRCLRRLGHLYMQQKRWAEAECTFMRILDTAPGRPESVPVMTTSGPSHIDTESSWIPDEISVYTYQHLARMASEMGSLDQCRYWFKQELCAAIKRWGPAGEYTAECLSLAYNEKGDLRHMVEQYPEVLQKAQWAKSQGRMVVSKARWCAVRNLI